MVYRLWFTSRHRVIDLAGENVHQSIQVSKNKAQLARCNGLLLLQRYCLEIIGFERLLLFVQRSDLHRE